MMNNAQKRKMDPEADLEDPDAYVVDVPAKRAAKTQHDDSSSDDDQVLSKRTAPALPNAKSLTQPAVDPATRAVEAIRQLKSAAEINQAIQAIKLQQTYIAQVATMYIRVGSVATFQSKQGQTVTGTVLKVNQKTIVLKCQNTGTEWKVSASLVTPV